MFYSKLRWFRNNLSFFSGGGEEKEQDKGSSENKEGEAAGGDKGDNEAEGVVDPVQ